MPRKRPLVVIVAVILTAVAMWLSGPDGTPEGRVTGRDALPQLKNMPPEIVFIQGPPTIDPRDSDHVTGRDRKP